MFFVACIAAAAAVVGASSAAADLVYFNDFDGGESFDGGVHGSLSGYGAVTDSQGFAGHGGFAGGFWRNADDGAPRQGKTTLTLDNLPEHAGLSIGMLLAIIDSWDGNGSNAGPDSLVIDVDGRHVFQRVFATASGTGDYDPPSGGLIGEGENFGFSAWTDAAYDLTHESPLDFIAHTGRSARIDIYASGSGWQGGLDESWAIDNLQVEMVTIPLPAAVWSGLLTLGVVGLLGRRMVGTE